ncbi:branched-chain amino acid ABC transporter permease [Leisingera daeponensis]|uniref:branched-chain amino acid ABC transporter permease n=1 Tax=Leisingera daeponensis TaxID=405746 RepID=UPI001C947814|nr:branched-chain amino acid ABC transporter permease [Leisingera daeponensis]MBY6058778.1 branched-chain amino acid ABC transporter permease [Leisingera daeponensis]
MIAMFSTLALSWNIIGGFAGYPSLATAAFVGLGSYVGTLSQINGVPMVAAWLLATLVVCIVAAGLGGLLLRLKGHYFAIGSIVLVELFRLIASSWSSVTGGGNGLNVPLLRWGPDEVSRMFLMVMLGLMILAFIMNVVVKNHRLGFGLRCIRQNEDAADMVGVDTTKYKVIGFVLSSFLCGTVGAVYASWTGYIDPSESFSIVLTLKVAVMALLGGAGTLLGPVIGASVFVILEEVVWVNFLNWNRAILGILIVVLIFFIPNGIIKLRVFSFLRAKQTSKSRNKLNFLIPNGIFKLRVFCFFRAKQESATRKGQS